MQNPERPIAFVLASTDHGTFILNRNDDHQIGTRRYGVGIEIMMRGSFCPDEVDLAVKLLELRRSFHGDGVVAIDCGANIGVLAVEMGRHMTGWGNVIAIEPQERIYYALAGNVAINNCFNVQLIHAAVGAADGTMRIPTPNYLERGSFGSLELRPLARPGDVGQKIDYREEAMAPVRAVRIDSLGLQRVDLIKVDVEGMEIEVLRGAAETLSRHKPIVLIEYQKIDLEQMTQMVNEAGYQIFNTGGMNLLAVHNSDPSLQQIGQDQS